MKGWIKMFRQITDWELYKDINSKVLFLHLLLTAAYTDYTTSDGFVVHAGCCFTSIRQLADETGLSIRQVRTALERLEATHSLTQQTTHRGTLIKVEKWAFFQGEREKATQQTTQQTTHYNNKNNKKINNNIYVMPKKKKNSFLNYEQRDYDFAEIERKIAEKNKEDYLKWHAEEAKNSR
jgi:DNA-binding transcriptional regulator YhcF (GntR family)